MTQAVTEKEARLVAALSELLHIWDYNGGGDAWCREIYGDDIKKIRDLLSSFESKTLQ